MEQSKIIDTLETYHAPWWVVLPSEQPPSASSSHWMSSGPKKSTKSFAAFGLRLILISCDVKNKQKTTTGTGGTMSIG